MTPPEALKTISIDLKPKAFFNASLFSKLKKQTNASHIVKLGLKNSFYTPIDNDKIIKDC
ncbi:MAG: hypothetical protein DHS20C07_11570 [Methyloligella sp.]|jgi:hypothetical protein|nr:MAG: hypothetical protein DHS20C07_11570 [Methyloligella sp.]